MKINKKNIFDIGKKAIIVSIIVVFVSSFSGCVFKKNEVGYQVDLEMWGLFEDSEVINEITREYVEKHPYVNSINYRKMTIDSYEEELLDAMAEGKGPDIFLIHNNWVPKYKSKISPDSGKAFGVQNFRNNFVDVAIEDFVKEGKVYGAPLSVDSLALYYNKDIFNANGIVSPPKTWDEFNKIVEKVTNINNSGEITRAGVALGTAYNINRSTDILELLMMQNGVDFPKKEKENANLNQYIIKEGETIKPGKDALNFYTQFSKSNSPYYTWHKKMHYSLDSFYEGKLAMMLNYSWHRDTIKSKNSKLNFNVAPVPQLYPDSPVNYANYWGYTVSKNKNIPEGSSYNNEIRIHEAWQFLRYLTTKSEGRFALVHALTGTKKEIPISIDPAKKYLEETKRPAARRDLVDIQQNDPRLAPFAYGNLIAKSWYKYKPNLVENILAEIIDLINKGNITLDEGLSLANSRINKVLSSE